MALLTVREAADQLGVHPETIRRAVRNKQLRAQRNRLQRGGPLLISEADLANFRISRTVEE